MRLRFTNPDQHPPRQVHYGYDFSGGRVCDVTEPVLQAKLIRSGYFSAVRPDQPAEPAIETKPAAPADAAQVVSLATTPVQLIEEEDTKPLGRSLKKRKGSNRGNNNKS